MGLARSIGKAIIDRLAPTGIGTNALIRIVRNQGYGYNAQEMGEDIRAANGKFKNEYWVRKLNNNQVVPENLMVNRNLNYPAKYRVYGTFSYYDNVSDDYFDVTKSFYTDDLTTKGAWVDDFTDTYTNVYNSQGQEQMGFDIFAVERNTHY